MPTLYNPHQQDVADNKDFVTRAYVGDVQGVIWKLVTTDLDPTNWTFRKFAELGKNQPITAPIALMNDPNNQRVYVMAGTGGDLRVSSDGHVFKVVDVHRRGSRRRQYHAVRARVDPLLVQGVESSGSGCTSRRSPSAPSRQPRRPWCSSPHRRRGSIPQTCTGFFNSSLYALGLLSGQAEVDLGRRRRRRERRDHRTRRSPGSTPARRQLSTSRRAVGSERTRAALRSTETATSRTTSPPGAAASPSRCWWTASASRRSDRGQWVTAARDLAVPGSLVAFGRRNE